jgi:PAS domain S-box-containing protein
MAQENNLIQKPIAIDKEVIWDKTQTIMSKTDLFGTIEYVNDVFTDVSGYEDAEIVSQPHNSIRHPDMPKAIFKLLWSNIKAGNQFHGIIKNLAKSGRYYWAITNFEYVKDAKGTITNYIAKRKSVPQEIITNSIEPLYKKILSVEQASGEIAAEKYLIGYLEEIGLSYVDYITKLMMENEKLTISETEAEDEKKKKKQGFFSSFFGN